ncbi:MAG: 1-acyl-sn-glycerol-3-phosphate acyltransferase [Actinobacteria bacterium]|nr:1-acyl-sn-glycerol-3-phosphate acyltransferase [Actinomycetota bacterium]
MDKLRRRVVSVPGLFLFAIALLATLPLWLPMAALADLVRGRLRLPTVRLLAFGLGWAWIESAGVMTAAFLWITGRSRNHAAHYRLMRWWAARLMGTLRVTTGIRVAQVDADCIAPGPVVLLCRHASLADSLLSAWVATSKLGMNPRYVLKRELLADPCLDIVGGRLPNYFLDRQASDSLLELEAVRSLSADMGRDHVAVIFPEGTRASARKRERALIKIGERDPERAKRLNQMRHLLPVRPAGSAALVAGCPQADVVIGWHVGFEGLDTFGGILRHLSRSPRPIRFCSRRIARADVPAGEAFTRWLDDVWLQADQAVDELLKIDDR